MKPLDLIRRNESFVETIEGIAPQYFGQLSQGQHPNCLMLACSDSRASPSVVTQAPLGTMFVHRNIANQVVEDDCSFTAALFYALVTLRVRRIVIKGHTGCGGVAAAVAGQVPPALEDWLTHVRGGLMTQGGETLDDLARANVLEQVRRLKGHPIYLAHGQGVAIEGYLLHLESGKLERLVEAPGEEVNSHDVERAGSEAPPRVDQPHEAD